MTTFSAQPHRYADGKHYRANRYRLIATEGARKIGVGGALIVGDKVIAYAGHPELGESVAAITKRSVAFVWGASLTEALAKIKPHLEDEL